MLYKAQLSHTAAFKAKIDLFRKKIVRPAFY